MLGVTKLAMLHAVPIILDAEVLSSDFTKLIIKGFTVDGVL